MKNLTDNYTFIHDVTKEIMDGKELSEFEAKKILSFDNQSDIIILLAHANLLRQHFHGPQIHLCTIVNARSGRCYEDCKFCAQSIKHRTNIQTYPLLKKEEILQAAGNARHHGIHRFSIVTSGKGIENKNSFDHICVAIQEIARIDDLIPCASLGILTKDQFRQIHQAGLRRYHHNLETAKSFFKNICTTHSFDDRVQTIRMAKEEGMEVCSGGILGLGETPQQRIELAFTLRDLDVDSVPLNFLNPIVGTPLEKSPLLPPVEILKTIALFRFALPEKEIRICGGREVNLSTLQPFIYIAGANGTMVGNYLTTQGRDVCIDIQEISDLGLVCK